MRASAQPPGIARGQKGQGTDRHVPQQPQAHAAPDRGLDQDQPVDRLGSEPARGHQRHAPARTLAQKEHLAAVGRSQLLHDRPQVADQSPIAVPAATAVRVAEATLVVGMNPEAAPRQTRAGLLECEPEVAERMERYHRCPDRPSGLPGDQRQPIAIRHQQHGCGASGSP